MNFYLGTPHPHWLGRLDVPLFVSARWLRGRKTFPRARVPWALDSGAFTELKDHGSWIWVPPTQYASEVRHWADSIGNMAWAAPQDWMCEPVVINGGTVGKAVFKGTGLSVAAHQTLTVSNYRLLRQLAPDLPWMPVLQGWHPDDYLRHYEEYIRAGVSLRDAPLVGVGSVCRRQATDLIEEVLVPLARLGLRLHAFGLKLEGIRRCGAYLASADSMAWSHDARNGERLPGCTAHKKCSNCPRYALRWREKVMRAVNGAARQEVMF